MKELRILVVVVAVISIMYWGVEPLAHSVMHPRAADPDYSFKDLNWAGVDLGSGDAERGRELVMSLCVSCHSISSQGVRVEANADDIVPPDLSNSGLIFSANYLAHFIKDPARASLLGSKFAVVCNPDDDAYYGECEKNNDGKDNHRMPSFSDLVGGEGVESGIADVVAYLVSIAPKAVSDKQVFLDACNRCHSVSYDKGQYNSYFAVSSGLGISTDSYGHGLTSSSSAESVESYLGAKAPDLSMAIRSKGRVGLSHFINNPQAVSYVEIKNSVLNSLLRKEKDREISGLDPSMSEEKRKVAIDKIQLKTPKDYGIVLPENTMKMSWQDDDDYSVLASKMGVMPIGKSMPRVGLTEEAENQVVNYLEKIGDSNKKDREEVGFYVLAFSVLLSILAYAWKVKVWKDLH